MKNIITLLILLSLSGYSQDKYVYFSAGFDVRNGILGSDPTNNKPSLNGLYQFGMTGNFPKHKTIFELSINYELFQEIKFEKKSFSIGHHTPLYVNLFNKEIKTTMIIGIEPGIITRWGNEFSGDDVDDSSFTVGGNLGFRWIIMNHFAIETLFTAIPRTDLQARYNPNSAAPIVYNGYFKLIFIPNI